MKNLKKEKLYELYEYLDGYSFVNYDEVELCVNDFFVENYEILAPSYWDLFFYHELALHYICDKWLDFSKDVVSWYWDLNHIEDWKREILDYRINTWLIIPSKE